MQAECDEQHTRCRQSRRAPARSRPSAAPAAVAGASAAAAPACASAGLRARKGEQWFEIEKRKASETANKAKLTGLIEHALVLVEPEPLVGRAAVDTAGARARRNRLARRRIALGGPRAAKALARVGDVGLRWARPG